MLVAIACALYAASSAASVHLAQSRLSHVKCTLACCCASHDSAPHPLLNHCCCVVAGAGFWVASLICISSQDPPLRLSFVSIMTSLAGLPCHPIGLWAITSAGNEDISGNREFRAWGTQGVGSVAQETAGIGFAERSRLGFMVAKP